jgi:hypothetical protein
MMTASEVRNTHNLGAACACKLDLSVNDDEPGNFDESPIPLRGRRESKTCVF